MKLKIIKSTWGMTGPVEKIFERIAGEDCYSGIESSVPDRMNAPQFRKLLKKYQLDFIPQIFTQGTDGKPRSVSFSS